MVYVSMLLPCKRLSINRTFKTLKPLAVDIRVGTTDMIIIGIYHPPKPVSGDYRLLLQDELNGICTWTSLQRDSVTILGDLSLHRVRPDKSEGKLLLDLEVEQEFTCLIDKATLTEQKGSRERHWQIIRRINQTPTGISYVNAAMKPRDRGEEQSVRIGGINRIILRRTQQISIKLSCHS